MSRLSADDIITRVSTDDIDAHPAGGEGGWAGPFEPPAWRVQDLLDASAAALAEESGAGSAEGAGGRGGWAAFLRGPSSWATEMRGLVKRLSDPLVGGSQGEEGWAGGAAEGSRGWAAFSGV